MKTGFSSLNELWGELVIDELSRCGVESFSLSSGSRSTPLTVAVSRQKKINTTIHFDERGAAFYALGQARGSGRPAAVICTSGTAAANLFPAIVEASVDHIPLIILTADRPPELRHTGANQTIDQVKMYGDYVRRFFDMPCPDQNIPPEFVLTTLDQAVYRATSRPGGPVHINFMFREPLAPNSKKLNLTQYLKSVSGWSKSSRPFTLYDAPVVNSSALAMEKVVSTVKKSKAGLIIAGKMNALDAEAVLKLSRKTGWPIFPDIGSGLRLGANVRNIVPFYDQMLFFERLEFYPDTVLQFGSQTVSKRLYQFLDIQRPKTFVRIINAPERLDPNHLVTLRLETEIADFCDRLSSQIKKNTELLQPKLFKLSKLINRQLADILKLENDQTLTEPTIARIVSQQIGKSGALFLASSMPVRDMDMFASAAGQCVPVEYNRGASGIDGTIATAVGYANGLKKTVTLLIGDLAFLHDLNSLELVRNSKFPVITIVVNNDGGGIFSFLPVAEIGQGFEKFFGTPHGLKFQKSAEQFKLSYQNPQTVGEFIKVYKAAQKQKRSTIIEINTERGSNCTLHQKIKQSVKSALDEA